MRNRLNSESDSLESKVLLSATPFLDITSAQFQSLDEFPESIVVSAEKTDTLQDLFDLSEQTGLEEITSFNADGEETPVTLISQTPTTITFGVTTENVSVAHSHPSLNNRTNPAFESSVIENDTLIESGSFSRAPSVTDFDNLRAGIAGGIQRRGDLVQADARTYAYYATDGTPVVPGFPQTVEAEQRGLDARRAERTAETEFAISPDSDGGSIITLAEQERIDEQGQSAYAAELNLALFRGETAAQADGSTQLQRIDATDTPAPLSGRELTSSIRRAEDSISRQQDTRQRFVNDIFAGDDADESRAERDELFEEADDGLRELESEQRQLLQLRNAPDNTAEENQTLDEAIESNQEAITDAQLFKDELELGFGIVEFPEDSEMA